MQLTLFQYQDKIGEILSNNNSQQNSDEIISSLVQSLQSINKLIEELKKLTNPTLISISSIILRNQHFSPLILDFIQKSSSQASNKKSKKAITSFKESFGEISFEYPFLFLDAFNVFWNSTINFVSVSD